MSDYEYEIKTLHLDLPTEGVMRVICPCGETITFNPHVGWVCEKCKIEYIQFTIEG